MHKGYKCLDVQSGRIYISRDVVFDESVFPFASLHPNAGAQLKSEISLLPNHLLSSSSFSDGDMFDHGQYDSNPHIDKPCEFSELG